MKKPLKPSACDADSWADGVMQVHAEAAGVLRLHILWPHLALELFASALDGNSESARLVHALADALRQIETAPPDAPAECGCCGSPLHRGAVIVVALPNRADPSRGLAFALCGVCTVNADEVHAKAVEALKILWPAGRIIEITHPSGGRA